MLPRPHGDRLVNRVVPEAEQGRVHAEARRLPSVEISSEKVREVENLATGIYSPLNGFMGKAELTAVLRTMRLPNGVPWTIPILLDVSLVEADRLTIEEPVALTHQGNLVGLLHLQEKYRADHSEIARSTFGTTDPSHPGVGSMNAMAGALLAGPVDLLTAPATSFPRYKLLPQETRVLFEAKRWRTVVGFQTRNVPHLGHEYVQKTALTFADGIFINPVIGKKKRGDFRDEAIIRAYEVLMKSYYPPERAVMAILETEMRYAGPREAIFHAIVRKNFGCTHFIVGRDHAGVGRFYAPYAAQEIFGQFPDLGIVPLFFTAFFYCEQCAGVANEKTCPHEGRRQDFSGTLLRQALTGEVPLPAGLIRTEVAAAIQEFADPFID